MIFRFPTVEKFLCCLKLETGGLVVGWFIAILFGLLAVFYVGVVATEIIGFKRGYTSSFAEDFYAGATSEFTFIDRQYLEY